MILSVATGKGGTGKTTFAVNLALSLPEESVEFIDCDVEEPNVPLFNKPEIHRVASVGTPVPRVDKSHGIAFVNGVLHIEEPMASPLIRRVKQKLQRGKTVILDAPPGTSRPVIETVKGSDFCVLVTEPTPFGLNDLELAVGMLKKLNTPMGVVVNKADAADRKVWDYCASQKNPVLMEIPLDRGIAECYSKGVPFVLEKGSYRLRFQEFFETLEKLHGSIRRNPGTE